MHSVHCIFSQKVEQLNLSIHLKPYFYSRNKGLGIWLLKEYVQIYMRLRLYITLLSFPSFVSNNFNSLERTRDYIL